MQLFAIRQNVFFFVQAYMKSPFSHSLTLAQEKILVVLYDTSLSDMRKNLYIVISRLIIVVLTSLVRSIDSRQ